MKNSGELMVCSLSDLKIKEVINLSDGSKLGFVDDVKMNTDDATILALVVYGRPKFFGLFGRDDDIIIKCDEIQMIGKDAILVHVDELKKSTNSREFSFENLSK